MCLLDYVDRYESRRLGLAASSIEQLRVAVHRFNAWAGRSVQLSELNDELLLAFLRAYLQDGFAAVTVNNKRRLLLTLWHQAAREGLAQPPGEILPIKEPRRMPEAWTVEEMERLLARCRQLKGTVAGIPRRFWWSALVLTVYDSGARITAVRSTKTVDYWPEESCLVLRAEVSKERCDRLVSLSKQTVNAIGRLYDPAREQLFPWPYGRHYLWQYFRKQIVLKAGVRWNRRGMGLFHCLRRTSGSLVEAAGGDGAKHLGNSRQVFLKHYRDPRICGEGQLRYLPRPKF